MDAAIAALIGAGVGFTGTMVAPIVTSYQARRAKSQELMRDAYARGFACLARIPRCDTTEDHRKLRDKMLEALAHIEIVGVKTTSDLYGTVVESYEAWKIQGGANTAFEASAKKFQQAARSDIASSDANGASRPALLGRILAVLLVLAFYWWARFPSLLTSDARVLGGLEFAAVVAATIVGVWIVVISVIKLLRSANSG
ncbi:hypothetical protein [Amycolatopsis sp. Hca4]|uniref:hypothetical protein n=1 Tax=Amycolatopsis sp. Hca4 TaxID=2742131 RepID=UPI0015922692|nr:hypothetical protein [Amycolatopsis sp. Hca4]QKV80669.1 hypothetical protein HUT10_48000 [Amycolatopsis sp. Hca4]